MCQLLFNLNFENNTLGWLKVVIIMNNEKLTTVDDVVKGNFILEFLCSVKVTVHLVFYTIFLLCQNQRA